MKNNTYKILAIIFFTLFVSSVLYFNFFPRQNMMASSVQSEEAEQEVTYSSQYASTESQAFRVCAMRKFNEVLDIITLSEERREQGVPIWFGGCNGNWRRPICEAGINAITSDKDDEFQKALNDCMVIELYK